MQCLLIDDDKDDQEIFLMAMLRVDPSIECRAVSSCPDALSMFGLGSSYSPQYIFLDINMPRVNGLECLTMLREFSALKQTQIILYSTSIDSTVMNQPAAVAASGFLVKPAGFNSLVEALQRIVKF